MIKKKRMCIKIGAIKSDDDGDASASEKEDEGTSAAKTVAKGKRKLQTRKGSKLLQLQTKAVSDSESDTGMQKAIINLHLTNSMSLLFYLIYISTA